MFKKLLSLTLTVLFALQTVSVMLDDYQPHQINGEQIVFDHEHKSVDTKNDCHHCCHCHASAQLTANLNKGFNSFLFATKLFQYNFNDSSISTLPNLRPPIA